MAFPFLPFLKNLLLYVATAALSYALGPKPQGPKASGIEDFNFPTNNEGKEISVCFGTCWIRDPHVQWFGDLKNRPIKAKGGKK